MKTITKEQLGKRLAELRKRAGYTQAQVAENLGLSNETLSRLERGSQWTDFDTFLALAKLYRVEWADLMAIIPDDRNAKQKAVIQEIVDLLRNKKLAETEQARDLLEVLFRSKNPKK